jgi:hypothetical protein
MAQADPKDDKVNAAVNTLLEETDARAMNVYGGPGKYATIALLDYVWQEDGEQVKLVKKEGQDGKG